jgi:type VII secretion protein EccE
VAAPDLIPVRRSASAEILRRNQNGYQEGVAALARRLVNAVEDRRRSGELLDRLLWGVNLQRKGGTYGDGETGGRGVGPGLDIWQDAADAALGDVMNSPAGSGGENRATTKAPMKAQRRLRLDLSWSRLTPIFVLDVAVLLLVTRCWPEEWQRAVPAWWVGAAVAAMATLAGMITYRGITLASGLAGWLWNWSADPEASLVAGCTPAIDHQRRFSPDVVGIREYRGLLAAVIAVDTAADEQSGRHHHHRSVAESSATLPVKVAAAGLSQFDVCLDGIDIVSVRTRLIPDVINGPGPHSDRPGIGADTDQLSTWLVLRMDPQRNLGGVAVRDSVASTLAAAVERLAHRVDGRQCAARPLTADEIAEVDTAVLAGLQPTWHRPGWRHLKHFNGYATSFWVSPADITSETLDALLSADTDATVVTTRLKLHRGQPEVSAWVRYHTRSPLPRQMSSGLNRLIGRQLAAVQASMPVPVRRPPLVVPARVLDDDAELAVPLGQLGQLPKQSLSVVRR